MSQPRSQAHEELAEEFTQLIAASGLSFSEIADRAGIKTVTAYRLVEGAVPRDNLLATLLDLLEAPPAKRARILDIIHRLQLVPGAMGNATPGIFISYRRSDEPGFAGRLYDRLESKFGGDQVFMDVDSIDLGLDFVEALEATLSCCHAVVAVIGKQWLTVTDSAGRRRIDDPNDYVRMEIERALARNIRVIPILVDGASMPDAADLPASIGALARRNGREMSHARFGSDCLELISTIERILGTQEKAQAETLDAGAPSAGNRQDSEPPKVYSSNEFNVAVTTEIRQIWWNRFNEKIHMELSLDNTKEPNGGFDGVIWPLDNPDAKIAVKTFPFPNERLRSSVALESLKGKDAPCLVITRLPLNEWSAIEQSYPPPVQFLHWTGSDEDKEALERSLRTLRDALN